MPAGRPSPLDPAYSVYLDLVRFLAAVLVVLMHFRQFGLAQGELAQALPFLGREAVVAFFVLSGFVIAYTTQQRRPDARAYVVARCARIYSVALPVLLLAFLAAALLQGRPGADVNNAYQLARPQLYIPFHLLFLGESWQLSEVPPWLIPWWSLNYEVWYYVLFGAAVYLRGIARALGIALVLAIMGIKLWLLLPVWLSGVALYHWQARHVLSPGTARIGWAFSLVLLLAYELAGTEQLLRQAGRDLWSGLAFGPGNADRFLADYLLGLIICLNLGCARYAAFGAIMKAARPIRRLASMTFTLYLSHAVVLGAWPALYPHDPASALDLLALAAAVALTTCGLALLTERRRDGFEVLFERITRLAWPRRGAPT